MTAWEGVGNMGSIGTGRCRRLWRYRLGVRIHGSQPWDRGSNPRTATNAHGLLGPQQHPFPVGILIIEHEARAMVVEVSDGHVEVADDIAVSL